MPNRILRDWTDSETIDELTVYAERFFLRLIMKVDDYGRFTANNKVLRGSLFILKDDVRDTDITRWLDECYNAGLILIYEVSNKKYLQIQNFKQTLRQKKEKYPPPNVCNENAKHVHSNCISDVIPEKKGNESKGKETEKKGNSPPIVENGIFYSIEHCVTVAMNDERWVKANQTSKKELSEFNSLLEKRGVYEKNPMDYKTHFANWKRTGKKDELKIESSAPPLKRANVN